MSFRLILSAIVMFVATTAAAGPAAKMTLLDYSEFRRLADADRQSYLEDLRRFARDSEASGGFAMSPERPGLWRLLWAQAEAQPGQPCIYAGYVSRFNSDDKCTPVKPTQTWTLKLPSGQTVSQKLCSGPGQTLCNPMLYGFGRADGGSYGGICTTSTRNPTADCESKYRALPDYPASAVTAQLLANGLEKDFNQWSKSVSDYCATDEAKKRQSGPCSSLTGRAAYLKNRLANGDRRSEAELLKRVSPEPKAKPAAVPAPVKTEQAPPVLTGPPATAAGAGRESAEAVVTPAEAPVPPPKAKQEDCDTADAAGATTAAQNVAKPMVEAQKMICKPEASATPAPGKWVNVDSVSFGIKSGKEAVPALMAKATAASDKLKTKTDGCPGGCKRKNDAPDLSMDTQPKPDPGAGCQLKDYQPMSFSPGDLSAESGVGFSAGDKALTKTFSGGNCRQALADWTQNTLIGQPSGLFGIPSCTTALCKNIDEVKCPSPCSLSNVLQVQDASAGGGCKLNVKLVVKCGPGKGSPLSAEWKAVAKVRANWSCEPGGDK